ncbi:DUF4169 family protein [Aestuariivirga sp.]|uniref:DUF4169 family protein n=1 Tax=Aestuariivirga sp. TaxID=2650926 RepID=UPI0039E65B51
MGEIVSLKLARKRKARDEKDARASENRLKFGQTKEERTLAEARAKQENRTLDGHKREE